MSAVGFVQYLRPDGREVRVSIDVPEEIAQKALALTQAGAALEIEVLATGDVSLTCELGERLLAVQLCENREGRPRVAAIRVIEDAHRAFAAGEHGELSKAEFEDACDALAPLDAMRRMEPEDPATPDFVFGPFDAGDHHGGGHR